MSISVAVLAGYLLVVGVSVSSQSLTGSAVASRDPQLSAIIPLAGAIIGLAGFIMRRGSLARTGSVIVAAYGILFIFSVGPFYAPLGMVMVLCSAALLQASSIGALRGG